MAAVVVVVVVALAIVTVPLIVKVVLVVVGTLPRCGRDVDGDVNGWGLLLTYGFTRAFMV